MILERAFREWSVLAWLSHAVSKFVALYRGHRARRKFPGKLSLRRAQQVQSTDTCVAFQHQNCALGRNRRLEGGSIHLVRLCSREAVRGKVFRERCSGDLLFFTQYHAELK